MRTRVEIENIYRKVCVCLQKNQLKDAFDAVNQLLSGENLWQFSDRKNELEDTYKTMLRYVVEGAPDPGRKALFDKLKVSVLEMTDALREHLLIQLGDNYEYQEIQRNTPKMRDCRQLADEYSVISVAENRSAYEALTVELFTRLWLTEKYGEPEYQLLQKVSDNETMVSAVMLHLLRIFDEKSVLWLFDVSENETNIALRCRAMSALVLVLYKYDNRLELYPNITNRFSLLLEIASWRTDFVQAMLQIVRTKDTDVVTKRLKEKILPEMMNLRSKIEREFSGKEDFAKNFSEENPEWKKKMKDIVQDNNFSEKLMDEFHSMQQSGADVFMSSFAQLKNFSFFGRVCNWFLPFDINHSDLQKGFSSEQEKKNVDLMMQSGYLCDSDKYSFCLSLGQIPASQKDMLFMSIGEEAESLEEMRKEKSLALKQKNVVFSSTLQNIYRYYKIFAGKLHLADVFTFAFAFHKSLFGRMMNLSQSERMKFAEYYFANGHYDSALEIYELIVRANPQNVEAECFQKIGYCYQNMQDMETALSNYERADLISPDNKWTLRRLAFCYRFTKQYERALSCYRRLQSLLPEDMELTLNEGYCLMELHRFDEAFQLFFKVEYAEPENQKVFRALLWCSFLNHKFEQAEKYAGKLLAVSTNAVDFMNAGHIKWALGKRQEALECYCQSVKLNAKGMDGFLDDIKPDFEVLNDIAAIDGEEISLMMEQLKYLYK